MKTFIRFSVLLFIFISGCKKDDSNITNPPNQQGTVTDIDGNIYHTVTIGTQVWMVENLKVTKYRNGDTIPYLTDGHQWINIQSGAYCNYDNSAGNSATYGHLYNYSAVTDSRNIAPSGWHIPPKTEFLTLKTAVTVNSDGKALIAIGTTIPAAFLRCLRAPTAIPTAILLNSTV
ncbi:MAG: fibrobacter succinogenes major paralogous domain-containing protein [Ignavibacteriales bacterium]|nr:fibrobacter succinogenes major paralogous domain-containing protein [Ignavibacteriales bacterium]